MNSSRKTSGTLLSRGGTEVTPADIERHQAKVAARRAERKAAKDTRKKACIHRGKRVSAADAYGPKGVSCCKLYECNLHRLCAIQRVLPDIACCMKCDDYANRKHDPDDGRNA